MEEIRETAFNWTTRDQQAFLSSNEKKVITFVMEHARSHPEEVTILKEPEKNGGYILASVPKTWMKIKPRQKRRLSEEQRENIKNRLLNSRKVAT